MNHNAVADAAQELTAVAAAATITGCCGRADVTLKHRGVLGESVSHVVFSARKCDDLRQLTMVTVQ